MPGLLAVLAAALLPVANASPVNLETSEEIAVTTTADSGAGSLRQAILDANAFGFGVPRRIVFRFPQPVTIRPLSPLPAIGFAVTVDGGHAVELRGDLQRDGDGISIDSACGVSVSGLTINGFPRNGVNVGRGCIASPVVIHDNTIVFNERGIGGSEADSVAISNNVIGNNRRSAIFLYGGRVADIRQNFIGVTRDGTPAPNGASGIYVSIFSASIEQNVIANNAHFGVAVSVFSPSIHLRENLIFDNGQTAIDYGLDLETPNGDDGGGTDALRPVLNHPVLTDAHYDAAAKKTIVRGQYESRRATADVFVEFFASPSLSVTGHAEARQFLGKLPIGSRHDFELAFDGDLTGQFIAATATYQDSLSAVRDVTSELSAPIRVSP